MNDFEEWKEWFDSHKDADGKIDLSIPNNLHAYLLGMAMPPSKSLAEFNALCPNLGAAVNFELPKKEKQDE
jgi:hypothetical protein